MLKSHYKLQADQEDQETEEYLHLEQIGEALPEETVVPLLPTYPERKLNRSEISVRLSLLGKTADGDG